MANKAHAEVIWFSSKENFHWACIALEDSPMSVQAILKMLPWSYDSKAYVVGIWGRQVKLDQVVKAGDRIELYRPLALTPNEIRLRRKKSN